MVPKLGLTWWENERKNMQDELNELLGDLSKLKKKSKCAESAAMQKTLAHASNIKQKQLEELRKNLRI